MKCADCKSIYSACGAQWPCAYTEARKRNRREAAIELRQSSCKHVWRHESIIQPGGRGYSSSWCRKCNISAFEHARRNDLGGGAHD